jgi:hypothetical protein
MACLGALSAPKEKPPGVFTSGGFLFVLIRIILQQRLCAGAAFP